MLLFLAQLLSRVIGSPERPHRAVVRGVGLEATVPSLGPVHFFFHPATR